MMKKLLSVLLAIAMVACVVAGFAGCSKSNGGDAESSSSSSESTSAKTVADLDKV